jgi:hypothetical protein
MATKRKRTDQISGKHRLPRMVLSEGIEGQFDRWRAEAKRRGWNLAKLIREAVEYFIEK